MARGKFIVLEGLDRSGKSTQVENLQKRITQSGREVYVQKFPDRTTGIGQMINSYLQSKSELDDRAIHLLFSANRWELAAAIEQDLANGKTIVADRYAFSGIAFSAAKGLPFDYCLNPDTGLPLPDLTIYLTLSPETAAKRGAYGEERYETLEMQKRVREQFALVGEEVLRRHGEGKWEVIEADGSVDEVEGRIWAVAERCLGDKIDEIGRLWT